MAGQRELDRMPPPQDNQIRDQRRMALMAHPFTEILSSHLDCKLACTVAKQLDALCETIAGLVAMPELGGKPGIDQQQLLRLIQERIGEYTARLAAMHKAFPAVRPTPEQLEAARREFDEEETMAWIKEIRETSGFTGAQLIEGLEPAAADE
jgi:hypothetical protein